MPYLHFERNPSVPPYARYVFLLYERAFSYGICRTDSKTRYKQWTLYVYKKRLMFVKYLPMYTTKWCFFFIVNQRSSANISNEFSFLFAIQSFKDYLYTIFKIICPLFTPYTNVNFLFLNSNLFFSTPSYGTEMKTRFLPYSVYEQILLKIRS